MNSSTDVLIVGSGLAGGIAALSAADAGAHVTVLERGEGATAWAQGGIVYRGLQDPETLKTDILQAGAGLNHVAAVELVAQEGPAAVERWLLKRLNIPFDENAEGQWDLFLEAAHQSPRILHVKDYTGRAVHEHLQVALREHPRIRLVSGTLVDLVVSDRHRVQDGAEYLPSRVEGAYVYHAEDRMVRTWVAPVTLLASGGYSSLYLHSTGPRSSRGDGIAVAHRAGARTLHMEFVQFHPTALFIPGQPRELLTEALRGAGAQLKNIEGRRFTDELAPRDVVARAIHQEMLQAGSQHVWLDLRPIADFEKKFPLMLSRLKTRGFDPTQDLIPVVPAAHYTVGGVWTDLQGRTSVPGLWAAGEVACTGLHGANRLASTSLLEALVFGERAGNQAAQESLGSSRAVSEILPWRPERDPVDPALLAQDWDLLRQTLWNYVGLVRSERRLRRAERMLNELRSEVEWFYKKSTLSEDLIGLRQGVLVATLLLYAALRRRESLGTHYVESMGWDPSLTVSP